MEKNTNGYILYDHKTRSVKIPCFEVSTIAKFGDGIEGKTIYYKDVNMKQRHVNYPIFHVEDMTKTDNCTPIPQKPTSKAQLKGNLSNANVKIYRVEDNGDKTLLYKEQTNSDGLFYEHKDELEDDKFYIYEVSGGGIEGTIRAVSKGSWIKNLGLKVSLASEIAYIYLAKDLKYGFDAAKVENRLNEVAKTILSSDISGDDKVTAGDLLVFDYQSYLTAVNSSEFSSDKLEEIISGIYKNDLSYGDNISSATIGHIDINGDAKDDTGGHTKGVAISSDGTKAFLADRYYGGLVIVDITNPKNPIKISQYNTKSDARKVILSQDNTKAFVANQENFLIMDITTPTNPIKLGSIDTMYGASGIALSKDATTAFIADSMAGLKIVDITDPTNPIQIGEISQNTHGGGTIDLVQAVVLSNDGTKAFIVDYSGLLIADVTEPSNPKIVSRLKTKGHAYGITISKDNTKVFIADTRNGLVIVDITNPINPLKIGYYPSDFVSDVTLSNDDTKVFLAEGFEGTQSEAITSSHGLLVINITNPSKPNRVAHYNTNGRSQEVILSSNNTKAFIADGINGLVIIDLELFTPISSNSSTK